MHCGPCHMDQQNPLTNCIFFHSSYFPRNATKLSVVWEYKSFRDLWTIFFHRSITHPQLHSFQWPNNDATCVFAMDFVTKETIAILEEILFNTFFFSYILIIVHLFYILNSFMCTPEPSQRIRGPCKMSNEPPRVEPIILIHSGSS
jgi:hypothetical protein